MLKRITLQRFRGFKKVDVELKPVTVVLGPNSSGKTSVLHAVRLACAALRAALEDEAGSPSLQDDVVHVCKDMIVRDHTRLMRVGEWPEIFTGRTIGEGIEVGIILEFEADAPVQRLTVNLAYARNAVLKMSVSATSKMVADAVCSLPKKSKFRPDKIREELRKIQPVAVLVPAFYGVILAEEYRSKAVLAQLLEGGEQSRIVRNLITRLNAQAFDRLNSFLKATVGARLTSCTPVPHLEDREHLEARFTDGEGELEMCSAGAGLVNLIAVFSALERYRSEDNGCRSLIFLLDEPEAHLHPKLQGDIGSAVADLVSEFGAQLIMATHSIEMINRLGRREKTALVSMDRSKSTATQLLSESDVLRELSSWCDLSPFASINFLSSRKILFHEGPTDATILTACAEAQFRSDPIKLRSFRQWTLVPLEGIGNAGASGVLAKALSPKVFPTLTSGAKASIVRVLDRDLTRTPGFSSKEDKHVTETQVVWGQYSIESLFLAPECLASWLTIAVDDPGTTELKLRTLAAVAIQEADKNQALEDNAIDGLSVALRSKEKPGDVVPKAREEARKNPAVWQHGRERAKFVLAHMRSQLPTHLQNRVRSSIAGLLESVPPAKTSRLDTMIPADVRKLLDAMVGG